MKQGRKSRNSCITSLTILERTIRVLQRELLRNEEQHMALMTGFLVGHDERCYEPQHSIGVLIPLPIHLLRLKIHCFLFFAA